MAAEPPADRPGNRLLARERPVARAKCRATRRGRLETLDGFSRERHRYLEFSVIAARSRPRIFFGRGSEIFRHPTGIGSAQPWRSRRRPATTVWTRGTVIALWRPAPHHGNGIIPAGEHEEGPCGSSCIIWPSVDLP